MARGKKTPEKETDELRTIDITGAPILEPDDLNEDVDMDQALAEVPDTHGEGIQGYMRDKIKNATPRY